MDHSRIIDLSAAFEEYLTPEAKAVHRKQEYSTAVEYNARIEKDGTETYPHYLGGPMISEGATPDSVAVTWPALDFEHDYVRRVALVQFLVQPLQPMSLQMELGRPASIDKWLPAYAGRELKLMARVFNRCVAAGWLAIGTWQKCCAVRTDVGLSTQFELCVFTAAPKLSVHELNAKLQANLFVMEGRNGDAEAWRNYERMEKHRRASTVLGTLPEDAPIVTPRAEG